MSASKCWPVFAILVTFLLLSPAVCPAADEGLASVQGTITLDGKPLADGRIIFYLSDGQFVGTRTKADGTFKLDRVPVGTHKVTVEYVVKGKNLLPAKYASEDESALRAEVKKGENQLNFQLASK